MKNGLWIWNVLLTLVAGFLLIKQFSSGGKKEDNPSSQQNKNIVSSYPFRIAYFEMDSVAANFEMVKEVKAELGRKEEENNKELDRLARQFQQRYMYYQNLAKAGTLTQAQSDSANVEIKRLDEEMKTRRQQLDQEYNEYMARRQNDIKTKIENFLKEFNKDHNYSYIVSYEQGLFYFKDTAYNITTEVVRGLNGLYKPASK